MNPDDLLAQSALTIGAAAAIITGIGVIWAKAVRPGCRKLRALYEWVKDLLQLLNYQLRPNTGHSIVDIVKRLDSTVADVRCDQVKNKAQADERHEETKGHLTKLDAHHEETKGHLTKLDERIGNVEARLPEGER